MCSFDGDETRPNIRSAPSELVRDVLRGAPIAHGIEAIELTSRLIGSEERLVARAEEAAPDDQYRERTPRLGSALPRDTSRGMCPGRGVGSG